MNVEEMVLFELFYARLKLGRFPTDRRVLMLYPCAYSNGAAHSMKRTRRNSHDDAVEASKQLCLYIADAHDRCVSTGTSL